MYLVLNKKSPRYQLVFFRDGKRTSVSTGTANKNEAEKFLALTCPPKSDPIVILVSKEKKIWQEESSQQSKS